jgi:histidinol-phosphate aminotransferase
MSLTNLDSQGRSSLPSPVPAISKLHRVSEAGSDTRQLIGLDRNERLEPFPDWFMDNIREAVQSDLLSWYPVQDELESELAKYLNLPVDRLILTPSSDSAFKALYQAYIGPGDGVVMLAPSYAMFPVYAEMFQGKPITVPFNHDLEVDTELLLESVKPGVRLVMIANPNQPTGTVLSDEIILELINRATHVGALVVIDEAYYPFSRSTAMPWVEDHPNLAVTRTLSKGAGLAGLRIGFVAAHPEVIGNLFKVRTVNDINSMSILCAREILRNPEIIDDYVDQVDAGREVLARDVAALGLTPLTSHANFMLIRVAHKRQPAQLIEALKPKGYLVKGLDANCVSDCIRVTLGPPELMSRFAASLKEVMESES